MQNEAIHEKVKRERDQLERQKKQVGLENLYMSRIIPKVREKQKFADELHVMYKKQDEQKYQAT